jgi:hypothetical protein
MKRITVFFMALLGFLTFTFAQESYTMYENTYLLVKSDKYKEFYEAMAEHNQKYHSANDPYHANVWMVSTGQYAGCFVWSMGPCTFSHLDARPNDKGHTEDWLHNVMPTIKSIKETGYWKRADELSYEPEGEPFTKLMITVYDLEPWQGYRFKEIVKKVAQVYKEKKYDHLFSIYFPQTDMPNERDAAIVWGYRNFADLDKDFKFKAAYEEVHGEGSWTKVMDEYKAVVANAVDEMWELVPELMGRPQE